MQATIYQSSTGPKVIAEMGVHNLKAAAAKLRREGDPSRADELVAMDIRLAEIELSPALQEQLADTPARHQIGGNHPPEPIGEPAPGSDPFEAIRVHIEDLDTEARNWADGTEITTDAQAAEVDRLIASIKEAIRVAETVQTRELAPLADQEKAIRERFYPLIGNTTKIKGSAIRAREALLAVKTKWAAKVAERQKAEADRLRKQAFDAAAQARQTLAQAPDDIAASETAEDLIKSAQSALSASKHAEKQTVKGLRTVWSVTITDESAALRSMWRDHRPELVAFALDLARRDAREGRRQIEGFNIVPEKVAA